MHPSVLPRVLVPKNRFLDSDASDMAKVPQMPPLTQLTYLQVVDENDGGRTFLRRDTLLPREVLLNVSKQAESSGKIVCKVGSADVWRQKVIFEPECC